MHNENYVIALQTAKHWFENVQDLSLRKVLAMTSIQSQGLFFKAKA